MKLADLRREIAAHRVLRRAMSSNGIDEKDDQYRLQKEGKRCITWMTCYCERGEKVAVHEFGSEDEACDYFLEWVLGDPTVRSKRASPG